MAKRTQMRVLRPTVGTVVALAAYGLLAILLGRAGYLADPILGRIVGRCDA